MVETLAASGVAALVAALWRLSNEHAGMRVALERGLKQVVDQVIALRTELTKDVNRLEDVLSDQKERLIDHEHRIRKLENNHEP